MAAIVAPSPDRAPSGAGLQQQADRVLQQAPDTLVGAVESNFFFVAPGLGEDSTGAAPLALWQKAGTAAPVELVQGIEDLQVLFGIDTTLNDGVPNATRNVTAGNVPDPRQIVTVRVSITANSVDAVQDGERMRRTFTKTLLVRNSNPEL